MLQHPLPPPPLFFCLSINIALSIVMYKIFSSFVFVVFPCTIYAIKETATPTFVGFDKTFCLSIVLKMILKVSLQVNELGKMNHCK